MKMKRKMHTLGWVRQRGVTLIELLVASTVSIIAVAGMLAVMAGTLGSSAHTIQMSKMTEELRTAMQIMSRELRRANYHADYLNCYGDFGCLEGIPVLGDISGKIGTIGIYESVDSEGGEADCIWFWYERPGSGSVNASAVAGFRRKVEGGIGRIQMTTGLSSVPSANCGTDSQWTNANGADITDPDFIDVLRFNVVNASPATEIINGTNDIQTVQRIRLTITAKLRAKASVKDFVKDNPNATRTLTEFVHIRNNFTTDV
jgi:hypothetical protein